MVDPIFYIIISRILEVIVSIKGNILLLFANNIIKLAMCFLVAKAVSSHLESLSATVFLTFGLWVAWGILGFLSGIARLISLLIVNYFSYDDRLIDLKNWMEISNLPVDDETIFQDWNNYAESQLLNHRKKIIGDPVVQLATMAVTQETYKNTGNYTTFMLNEYLLSKALKHYASNNIKKYNHTARLRP